MFFKVLPSESTAGWIPQIAGSEFQSAALATENLNPVTWPSYRVGISSAVRRSIQLARSVQ